MTQLRIDRATESDTGAILSLIKELAAYEAMSDHVVATEANIAQALFGNPPTAEALLARAGDDDEVVGFALFFHTYSTFLGRRGLYLEDLFIKCEARGKGYGRRLLVELARIAVTRGCGRVEWSVLDWNELAQASYRKAGAQPLNEWTVWRLAGEDLVRLARE